MNDTLTAPAPPTRAQRLVRALTYALPAAAVLFGVGLLVRSEWDPLIRLDDALIERATAYTRPREGLTDFLVRWQELTQPFKLYLAGTALCLWAWLAKGLRTRAAWAFITMMLAWMVGLGAKYLFQRARPVLEDPVSTSPGYSFPSGHALNSAAWATIVVLLLWPLLRSRASRVVAVAAAVAMVTVTASDRVLLGVHFPSDVTVGVITGVGLVLASYAGYRRQEGQ
ncbi:phosphatase PAP2 family protein [Ornithinibacter aureus]|uniref:phosphatase PAP2 family protein n=1 Tax=Ornithinibacter aureus TaxID=622664 RepID=UPI001357353F|nr:phosphatase PAP2 family protein [Ornithinibacter aureus]